MKYKVIYFFSYCFNTNLTEIKFLCPFMHFGQDFLLFNVLKVLLIYSVHFNIFFKVIKMLILVIVLFHGCWGPRLIINALIKYGLSTFTVHTYRLRVAAYLLSFSHSAINPIIYGFMSTAFRRMMFQCCKDGFCCNITCCNSTVDKKGNHPHNPTDLESYVFSSLTDSIRKSKQLNSIYGENSVILTTV